MKTKVIITVLAVMVFVSCGKSDKVKQLADLRKQHDEIASKIKTLEDEIAAQGGDSIDLSKARLVSVQEIKTQDFNHYIEVQGKLDGDENVAVSAQSGGNIQEIYVKVGQRVTKDQILARLDDKVLVQSLKELETGLQYATDVYNKQKALWDQKIGSEMQYLNAKNQKDGMEQKQATLRNQLDLMHIKSPINGTVEEIPVKAGQMLAPGVVAFRVVNFGKIKVVADVAESYSSKIKEGDEVKIFFPDINQEINAKVSFASKFISNINRTFTIEVQLASSNQSLKANMVAMLKVNDYSKPKAIAVPVNLVQKDLNGYFVYTVVNNKVKKSMVEEGIVYNGNAEITKGLNVGDKIVTAGYADIEDGERVKF